MKKILVVVLLLALAIYLAVGLTPEQFNFQMSNQNESWQWQPHGMELIIVIPVLLLVGVLLFFIFTSLATFLLALGVLIAGLVVFSMLLPFAIFLAVPALIGYLIYLLCRQSRPVQ